jgi:excisionase family DNA binding protein
MQNIRRNRIFCTDENMRMRFDCRRWIRCAFEIRGTLLRSGSRADTSSPMGNCGATASLRLVTCLFSTDWASVTPGVNAGGCATNLVVFFCKHTDTRAFVDTSWLLGASKRYLEASSPRRVQIEEHLQEIGRQGAGAAQVAAHRTRDSKELHTPQEVLQQHRELAARFGHQADRVVAKAQQGQQVAQPEKTAQQSVTYSRSHVFERSAVQDERAILQAAIDRSMGQASHSQVRHEFEQRVAQGEFREIVRSDGRAAPLYKTSEMLRMEREIVGHMQRGNQRGYGDPMLVSPQLRIWTEDRHPELNRDQRKAVDEIFISREKIVGLDGVAGAGKTTALSVVREGAEAEGYKVEGFAPTSRAAHKLAEAGMETSTLQLHLAKGAQPDSGEKRLCVSVYREEERAFSVGDRIQFTAPSQELKIANRELGTVEGIAQDGTMRLKLDNERSVDMNPQRHPHLDHGYAVTSYSSQGQTAERVLVHVDTELDGCIGDKLLVSREEAAQLLSISQRGLDYLVASKRLPTRRIGGRVLIPVADLRKYACCDHPERIVS